MSGYLKNNVCIPYERAPPLPTRSLRSRLEEGDSARPLQLKQSVFGSDLTDTEDDRIYTMRCGALSPEEFEEQRSNLDGYTHQATLDPAG